MAFIGLFVLTPARFGAHLVSEADLDALVYVWWVLGRALGVLDRFNVCDEGLDEGLDEGVYGGGEEYPRLEAARSRCRAVVGWCAVPRLARATERWHLMSAALCDGTALAAPGMSLPLALASLEDILRTGALAGPSGYPCRAAGHPAVERLLSARDRLWRRVYALVLDGTMRHSAARSFNNGLFRLALWVSEQAARLASHMDSPAGQRVECF